MPLAFLAFVAASPGPDAVNASHHRQLATYPWRYYAGEMCPSAHTVDSSTKVVDPICMVDAMDTTVDPSVRPGSPYAGTS